MNEKIKVSIICMAYNHEKFITKALDGFLMQKTNFEYEILISDDASTDNTARIIKEYEKKYPEIVKPIYFTKNLYSQGIIPSTYLYEKSQGKYLAICEGDDYWIDENKLQKQVDFLEKNKEYSAVYHNVRVVDENGNKIKNKKYLNYFEEHTVLNYVELKYNNNLCGQTSSILARNFWGEWNEKEKEIYLNIKANGDRKLSLYFVSKGKVKYFKEFMSCYRKTFDSDSWSSKNKNKNLSFQQYKSYEELKRMSKLLLKGEYKYDFSEVLYISVIYLIKNPSLENAYIFKEIFYKSPNKFRDFISMLKKMGIKLLNKMGIVKEKKYWKEIIDDEE